MGRFGLARDDARAERVTIREWPRPAAGLEWCADAHHNVFSPLANQPKYGTRIPRTAYVFRCPVEETGLGTRTAYVFRCRRAATATTHGIRLLLCPVSRAGGSACVHTGRVRRNRPFDAAAGVVPGQYRNR
ncbi:hypothetical protein C476_11916 [Natrinema limicola JCM 13563]|uniref:Uncharacterized protein n=1 Tax=Natrinema limicola JCM 13563 TaxID=1230457 RepID=M0C8A3_9EURY|nr:hypothetical protein C476_11916 [Natrinema limicola JCM 13563]